MLIFLKGVSLGSGDWMGTSCPDGQTDNEMDIQTAIRTDRQRDGHSNRDMDRQTTRWTLKQRYGQTDNEMDIQTTIRTDKLEEIR